MNLGRNQTQVGVNQFSSWQSVEMPLNGYDSATPLSQAIKRIPYHNSGTSIGEAIQHALDHTFVKTKGDRPCSQDVLIVITDGNDNGNLGIESPVSEAVCRGIMTVAVGIGAQVVDSELLAIAAGHKNRVFKVENIDALFSIQDHFCNAIEGKLLNPCDSNPCSQFGSCYVDMSGEDVSFRCFCSPGFSGTFCQIDLNECESNPCENDGTCKNLISSYKCDCKYRYHGINCQYSDSGCPCWLIYVLGSLLLVAVILIIILLLYICCKKKKRNKDRRTQTDFSPPSTPEPVIIYETVIKEPEVFAPPPIPPEPEENHILPPLDIVFLVDNSGSVGNSNFKRVRTFLTRFLDHVTLISPEDSRPEAHSLYGLVLFNREPRIGIPMAKYNKNELSPLIEKLPYEGHSTNLGEALIYTAKILGTKVTPNRSKIAKVVLILSDGYSADDVFKGSSALHSLGAIVLAVGIRKFNPVTLNEVVNHKPDRIFYVVDFESMKSWLRINLVREIKHTLEKRNRKKQGQKKPRSRSSVAPSE